MEIKLNANNYGYELIVEAENVKIAEDIESRVYEKDENGKTIFKSCKRDISTEYLDKIINLLDDMIYYREEIFDSSELIKNLFQKLSEDDCKNLLETLNNDYQL